MKKYYGLPLTAFVPGRLRPGDAIAISNADFAQVDMWTVPRGALLFITNSPALGAVRITRTTRSFRIDWILLAHSGRGCGGYSHSILSTVLCEAAAPLTVNRTA